MSQTTATEPPQTPDRSASETSELEARMDAMCALRASRREDWDALAFQTKAGPQYRRAQIRYIGSGGTGNHEGDERALAAEHFTFSNMLLPPGAEGPEHTHHDVEEAFFVLEGQLEVTIHEGDCAESRLLEYRDLIKIPAGQARSLRNVGDTDALFVVMLGASRPQLPTYPPHSPMTGITRD